MPKLGGIAADIAGIAGAALIAYGGWRIYPPAGFITGGVLLLCGSILDSIGKRRSGIR